MLTHRQIKKAPSAEPVVEDEDEVREIKNDLIDVPLSRVLRTIGLLVVCSTLIALLYVSCDSFNCSSKFTVSFDLLELLPKPTLTGFLIYLAWFKFQFLLYILIPGKIVYGEIVPSGAKLQYISNGCLAWVATTGLFLLSASRLQLFNPSDIVLNWGSIVFAANSVAYVQALGAYLKSMYFPSNEKETKFSTSIVYDMYIGNELNPRLGLIDFKIFQKRLGLMAIVIINFSFATAQIQELGYMTNAMTLVNGFYLMYTVDFFWNEEEFVRAVEIRYEYFGLKYIWTETVAVPMLCVMQAWYIYVTKKTLAQEYFNLIGVLGLLGYYIYRSANNQKTIARQTNGVCYIWGNPSTFIRTNYIGFDGRLHGSILLCSGFWGIVRHANYIGELIFALAICATCAEASIVPYIYFYYKVAMLKNRMDNAEQRSKIKYGAYWVRYCKRVPNKLIPWVY